MASPIRNTETSIRCTGLLRAPTIRSVPEIVRQSPHALPGGCARLEQQHHCKRDRQDGQRGGETAIAQAFEGKCGDHRRGLVTRQHVHGGRARMVDRGEPIGTIEQAGQRGVVARRRSMAARSRRHSGTGDR